jgi:hypothetical protein
VDVGGGAQRPGEAGAHARRHKDRLDVK